MTVKAPLRYQIRGTENFDNSVSDNISLGGIGFTHNKFIAPMTHLMLQINLLSRQLNPVGRVTWVNPLSHSDRYRLGIEFVELDPQEKNYLADYINLQKTGF